MRHIIRSLAIFALGAFLASSALAQQGAPKASRSAVKKPRAQKAWGLTWHPDVEAGLRRAKLDTLKRGQSPKRLLWVRILGELEGKA
jgi:hypothetical protein